MRGYDPEAGPEPAAWLALDEHLRLVLVEQYHRRRRIRLPNIRIHAVMHTVVESQLAEDDEVVNATLVRLQQEGLTHGGDDGNDRSARSPAAGGDGRGQSHGGGARTAPKTRGLDALQTLVLDGEDLEALAAAMEAKGQTKRTKIASFPRDAQNVRVSAAVLLLGVTGEPKRPEVPLDCGACGCGTCKEFIETSKDEGQDFRGPLCIYQTMDLGIALGVAAKVAGDLCVDSRIMYTIGAAARQAGYLKGCDVVIGLPLSVSGKSPYFDRA